MENLNQLFISYFVLSQCGLLIWVLVSSLLVHSLKASLPLQQPFPSADLFPVPGYLDHPKPGNQEQLLHLPRTNGHHCRISVHRVP